MPSEEPAKAVENASWHIHDGKPVDYHSGGVSFGMLLNLASVAHTEGKDVLWQYLRRYVPGATPENAPYLDKLLQGAVAYFQDFVKATKKFRLPNDKERAALQDLTRSNHCKIRRAEVILRWLAYIKSITFIMGILRKVPGSTPLK